MSRLKRITSETDGQLDTTCSVCSYRHQPRPHVPLAVLPLIPSLPSPETPTVCTHNIHPFASCDIQQTLLLSLTSSTGRMCFISSDVLPCSPVLNTGWWPTTTFHLASDACSMALKC